MRIRSNHLTSDQGDFASNPSIKNISFKCTSAFYTDAAANQNLKSNPEGGNEQLN